MTNDEQCWAAQGRARCGAFLLTVLALGAVLVAAGISGCAREETAPSATTKPAVDVASVRSKAETGDAAAQAQLGALYAAGEGVTNSYSEAARWYRKAADQGNAEAMFALGELHEAGQGVAQDEKQALAFYRQSAEKGLAKAQYTLGFLHESGRGVPKDHAAAAKWFRMAAEQGEPLSQYDLGQRYELGVGVAADKVEALKWFSLAAQQGQADAAARRDKLKKKLSGDQIREAEQRAQTVEPGAAKQQR